MSHFVPWACDTGHAHAQVPDTAQIEKAIKCLGKELLSTYLRCVRRYVKSALW